MAGALTLKAFSLGLRSRKVDLDVFNAENAVERRSCLTPGGCHSAPTS